MASYSVEEKISHVAAFKNSDLTMRQYALDHGINPSTFADWVRGIQDLQAQFHGSKTSKRKRTHDDECDATRRRGKSATVDQMAADDREFTFAESEPEFEPRHEEGTAGVHIQSIHGGVSAARTSITYAEFLECAYTIEMYCRQQGHYRAASEHSQFVYNMIRTRSARPQAEQAMRYSSIVQFRASSHPDNSLMSPNV